MNEKKDSGENNFPPLMSNTIAAGFPSPAEQYVEAPLDLNQLLISRPAATFFLRVAGDSMIDAGIFEGDILVVDRSIEAKDGMIVVACVDGEFTVKTLKKNTGSIRLEPANSSYPVITFKEGMELRIFGVVTSTIHRLINN
ncbi:MAG: translesion error-prone DNA polymerase V autoproteolytic subunit [Kiritimatiellae bacterium]|nr:translesion error-prone DNA polymerase V autoproteolytic subunit [Kiritimatiellia bacterium]